MSLAGSSHRPRIAACVRRSRSARLMAALDSGLDVTLCESFDVLTAIVRTTPFALIVVDARDDAGGAAAQVIPALEASSESPIVLYAAPPETAGLLGRPGVVEWIVVDRTDSPAMLRSTFRRLLLRRAADVAVAAMRQRLTGELGFIAETAVRHPACASIDALADHIGVHRQTLALWCRNARSVRAEELLIWARLLLASSALVSTEYPAAALATDLDFPSVVAFRNQLKRYTGLTSQEVRAAGLGAVLARFDAAIAAAASRRTQPGEMIGAF